MLVLIPWLIFGVGLAVIGYRLLRCRAACRRCRGGRLAACCAAGRMLS
jgi:hypothetical protein